MTFLPRQSLRQPVRLTPPFTQGRLLLRCKPDRQTAICTSAYVGGGVYDAPCCQSVSATPAGCHNERPYAIHVTLYDKLQFMTPQRIGWAQWRSDSFRPDRPALSAATRRKTEIYRLDDAKVRHLPVTDFFTLLSSVLLPQQPQSGGSRG